MKLAFADFWDGFKSESNFFLDLFKDIFPDVILTDINDCDVVIYSCFGNSHHNIDRSKIKKIFYTGENLRPNYNECDFSFTFDFDDYDGRNIRIPLWLMQLDWWNKKGYGNPEYVIPLNHIENNPYTTDKSEFCTMVVNNFFPDRKAMFDLIETYKPVKRWGKMWGNWFYGESGKMDIISKGKFSVCFENTKHKGYYTEKPIHARIARTIPIYSADDYYVTDFNHKGFMYIGDYGDPISFMNRIKQIDQSQDLFLEYINQPIFNHPTYPYDMMNGIREQIKKLL